ncbi:MAG TPA: DUF5652 family protein [Candidatus Paceibacterota bacterium]|nr:DUF5652 family protein [Candidatus Paceibacterota bacterium]
MTTYLKDTNLWIIIVSIIWVLPWKGYALWTASRRSNKGWFIAILILNTFAILEIFYIFYIAKRTPKDILNAIKNLFKRKA